MKILKKCIWGFLILILLILLILILLFFFYKFNNKEQWYTNNPLIGHALYGIDQIDYTNSKEALDLAYANNIRVVEADFLLTTDKKLVLKHYWEDNKISSYSNFMLEKINDKYTPMDINMLLDYMEKYQDLYVVIDTKENEYSGSISSIYKQIVVACQERNPKLLERFIAQVYSFEEYDEIKNIYNFSNYIFSTYKLQEIFPRQIVYFSLINNIRVIAVPTDQLEKNLFSKEDIELIKSKNIKLYVYTVNDENDYNKLLAEGIDGIYTDYLK